MVQKSLVCCAQSFGYGPAAKLILLAGGLRERGFRPVFLGTGIAHELASRSPVFDEVICALAGGRAARAAIEASCGLLSVMDRDHAAVALEQSRPVFVADSLAWLRQQFPEPFRLARRYWVQRFGVREDNAANLPRNAVLVGPIVPIRAQATRERGSKLIVALGGGESPHGTVADDPAYIDFVVRGIVASRLASTFPGAIVLLAGKRCVHYLRDRHAGVGIEFCSVSHEDALQLFSTAACVLTAPGLTTSLECFQLGVPTFFLPPQNYSQWRILQVFRGNGLAPASFHWEDLPSDGPAPEKAVEAERTPLIRQLIQRRASDAMAVQLLQASLQGCLVVPEGLALKQRAFFDGLGRNGVEQIIDDLAQMS